MTDKPRDKVVRGAHDLSDHPGLKTGTILNPGDTVLNRETDAPTFRRPVLEELTEKQSEGVRKTTDSDPARKTGKAAKAGDGAGPES